MVVRDLLEFTNIVINDLEKEFSDDGQHRWQRYYDDSGRPTMSIQELCTEADYERWLNKEVRSFTIQPIQRNITLLCNQSQTAANQYKILANVSCFTQAELDKKKEEEDVADLVRKLELLSGKKVSLA